MILSIAANGKDMSFSADTGMAECLAVARKRRSTEKRSARFVSLSGRPHGLSGANETAKQILAADSVRGIEDGPYGGTTISIGESAVGEMLDAPLSGDGAGWGSVRLKDASVAQTALALARSRLWLPGRPAALDLNMAPLNQVGKLGLVDRDITGPAPRGPFDKASPSPTATYTSLWNHNAKNETRIVCEPDSQLKRGRVWKRKPPKFGKLQAARI